MQAANVLIRQDKAWSLLPGNFAHVIFNAGGLKGSPALLVSARSPPLINVGCIPLIKLLAQQYLLLSFYPFCTLNCSLCLDSQILRAWPAPESSAPIYYFRARMAGVFETSLEVIGCKIQTQLQLSLKHIYI